jgi:hypothetical protein
MYTTARDIVRSDARNFVGGVGLVVESSIAVIRSACTSMTTRSPESGHTS